MAELTRFEPNQSPFFTFSIYKASRYLKLNRKFREIFSSSHSAPRAKTVGQKFRKRYQVTFNFNYGEFAIIKSQVGLNNYKISVKEWVEKTKAIGLKASALLLLLLASLARCGVAIA